MDKKIKSAIALSALLFAPLMACAGYPEGRDALLNGDMATAVREFGDSARSGDPNSQYAMGMLAAGGLGMPRSDEESARWFAKAAMQGHVLARYNSGLAHQFGIGAPTDMKEAERQYRLAAQSGLAQAQADLGFLYFFGIGVERDYLRALAWLRKAAGQGHLFAQANLACALLAGGSTRYAGGEGGPITIAPWVPGSAYPPDEKEAARWLRAAAERGHVVAQYSLATLLEQGRGVERDLIGAVRLYEKAAAAEFLPAFLNLAALYERGAGAPPAPDAPLRLRMKSSRKGVHRARELPILFMQFGVASRPDEIEIFVGDTQPGPDQILSKFRPALLVDPELALPRAAPARSAGGL
jgi:TPR repeat protein